MDEYPFSFLNGIPSGTTNIVEVTRNIKRSSTLDGATIAIFTQQVSKGRTNNEAIGAWKPTSDDGDE